MGKQTRRKSAALIITLIVISAVAVFAFTIARSTIASLVAATQSTDAVAARQAANGGIEWGILAFKERGQPYPGVKTTYSVGYDCYLNFENNQCVTEEEALSLGTYAKVSVLKNIIIDGVSAPITSGWVKSIGIVGKTSRDMIANIDTTGRIVLGDRAGNYCPPAWSTAANVADTPSSGLWAGGRSITRDATGVYYAVFNKKASTSATAPSNIFLTKSTDNGVTWTEQQITSLIYPSTANNGSVAIDGNNEIHIVWSQPTGLFYCKYSIASSTCVVTQTLYSGGPQYPAVAVDGNNGVHVVWAISTGSGGDVEYCKLNADGSCTSAISIYHNPSTSSESVQSTALAVDRNNNIHVVWDAKVNFISNVFYRVFSGGAWQAAQQVSNGANEDMDPSIALDSNNKIHLAWQSIFVPTGETLRTENIVYCQYSGTGLCSNLRRVTDKRETYTNASGGTSVDTQEFPDIALDQSDQIQIAWDSRHFGIQHCQYEGNVCGNPDIMQSLASGAQYIEFVSSLWANFPVVSNKRTNILAAGWAGVWMNFVNNPVPPYKLMFGNACMVTNSSCVPTKVTQSLICPAQGYHDSSASANETSNCGQTWAPSGQNLPGEDSRAGRGAKDPRTGLIWSKPLTNNAGTVQFTDTPVLAQSIWSWSNFAPNNVAVGNKTASQLCSDRGSGWRLPTEKEVEQAYIDGAYWNLNNTVNKNYWAATYGSTTANAWLTNFADGGTYYEPIANVGNNPFVRCVAESTPPPAPPQLGGCSTQNRSDYLSGATEATNCSQTWIPICPATLGDDVRSGRGGLDPKTGLTWSKLLRNNAGKVEFAETVATASVWSWGATAANNVAVGGKTASQLCSERGDGWRLPTQKEAMQAYIDGAWWNLANLTSSTDNWTSTQVDATNAWVVTLYMGDSFRLAKTSTKHIRCVR